jgi:DNA modification methylase
MKEVPAESVHLIINSLPYWQLKDNGNGWNFQPKMHYLLI